MSKTVDLELKKAFTELQQKMLETTQKLKLADLQIEALKRTIQHAQLTDKEISGLKPETKTYETVGRMFLLTPIDDVRKNLERKTETCAEKIKGLESKKQYLEQNLKDSENNLREMVQQRKEMTQESS